MQNRIKSFQKKITSGAALITDPSNIAYLTGFTGSNGTLLLTSKKAHFFTDARYTRVAKKVVPKNVEIHIVSHFKQISDVAQKLRIKTISFEEPNERSTI